MGKKRNKKNRKKSKVSEAERLKILERYSTKSVSKSDKKEIIKNSVDNSKFSTNVDETLKAILISLLGHVDSGKTSLKDIIKKSSDAKDEEGGITQAIGSNYVPIKNVLEITKNIKGKFVVKNKLPGLLIVDTPGHFAYGNLRKRGSRLCDIAILVIDIKDGRREKGLQPQTKESIKLLKENKIPFVIAATKLDTIDGWTNTKYFALRKSLKEQQNKNMLNILEGWLGDLKYELSKEEIESEFYLFNEKPKKIYSIVPISNKTKEGLADLLSLLVFMSQNWMGKKITYRNKVSAVVMESKKDDKNGFVIDIILKNGTIKIGDKFVISTKNGPKITTVRNLLANYDNEFKYYDNVRASQGIRIIGSNLQNCYAGTKLHIINEKNSESDAIKSAEIEINEIFNSFNFNDTGIYILTPTLSDLEAAIRLFKNKNVKIIGGDVGLLNEKSFNFLESKLECIQDLEYRVLLYFGKIDEKNRSLYKILSEEKNIKLIDSAVIFTLFDKYQEFYKECINSKEKILSKSGEAVFPCELEIIKDCIFMNGGSDDLMFGVKVVRGNLYVGTPLVAIDKKNHSVQIGNVISIQENHKDKNKADKNSKVCIRISKEKYIQYGEQICKNKNDPDKLFSNITRSSIDTLKKYFAHKLTKEDVLIMKDLKNILNIE